MFTWGITTREMAEVALYIPIKMHLTNTFAGKSGFQNTPTMMSFKNAEYNITYTYSVYVYRGNKSIKKCMGLVDSKFGIEVTSFRRGYCWKGNERVRYIYINANCIDNVLFLKLSLLVCSLNTLCI